MANSGQAKIGRIMNYFREANICLKGFEILAKDDVKKGMHYDFVTDKDTPIHLPESNVIKYYLNDNMWFVLRPSGTEPKLKVYYGVKGNTDLDANEKLSKLSKEVLAIVNMVK